MSYIISKSLRIDYEWDKGSMPSGYAYIKLQIQPLLPQVSETIEIRLSDNPVWKVRATQFAGKQPPGKLDQIIPQFVEMAMTGIKQGCTETMAGFLKQPVINVQLIVEELVFDLLYSTEVAFRMATKMALSELLSQAQAGGLLKAI